RAAAATIAGHVERTATKLSRTLSKIAGCDIYLKFENEQFTASFKERGALNRLSALNADERRRGVIAMSAGNHAQGVAYHAGRLGVPATIVMPEGTPFKKVQHTREFGAHIVIGVPTLSDCYIRAKALAAEHGYTLIHPYDDPLVIAGQGTAALEFLAQAPDIDTLVVPVGGGGLISGMAIAAKGLRPGIQIFGVEARLYPAMHNALTGDTLPCAGQTIAEGIAVKDPGAIARDVIAALVSDVLLVSDAQTESAIVKLLEIEKTVAEGAGAAPLAAVLANPDLFRGRKTGIVVSGGNIDMRLLSNVILRELAREGRILSLVITIEDRPGLLARITAVIGDAG